MKTKRKQRVWVARNPDELGDILGLSEVDKSLMRYKVAISRIAIKAIRNSGLTVNEIVKRSGVARSKVSAVKNGATASISIDLLFKVIAATGTKLSVRAA